MMDLPSAEKIKHPVLALIAGLLIGLGAGWGAAWKMITDIRDAEVKDLQRQVSDLQESNQAKDAELARIREQLSMLAPQRREADAKRRRDLEAFIRGIDKEIAERRAKLWRSGGDSLECDPKGENCRWVRNADRPMTDAEKRLERELDALNMQRHEARKRLIEAIAQ
jgi:cell division protein FtsB